MIRSQSQRAWRPESTSANASKTPESLWSDRLNHPWRRVSVNAVTLSIHVTLSHQTHCNHVPSCLHSGKCIVLLSIVSLFIRYLANVSVHEHTVISPVFGVIKYSSTSFFFSNLAHFRCVTRFPVAAGVDHLARFRCRILLVCSNKAVCYFCVKGK